MEEVYEKSIFEEDQLPIIYGGFWERFGALFLDALILLPITILNYYNRLLWQSIPLLIVANLISIVYKPLLEFLYGATPGKKALSLTVVNRAYQKISLPEAILRNIFGIVTALAGFVVSMYALNGNGNSIYNGRIDSSTDMNEIMGTAMLTGLYGLGVFFLYLADAICLAANSKKQSLHDLIANTYVIRK